MDAKEEQYVVCHNGVFILPDTVFKALASLVSHGSVYVRQDDEVLTISTSRLVGGHRRALSARFRVPMFRHARRLAIVDLRESLRVMAVR